MKKMGMLILLVTFLGIAYSEYHNAFKVHKEVQHQLMGPLKLKQQRPPLGPRTVNANFKKNIAPLARNGFEKKAEGVVGKKQPPSSAIPITEEHMEPILQQQIHWQEQFSVQAYRQEVQKYGEADRLVIDSVLGLENFWTQWMEKAYEPKLVYRYYSHCAEDRLNKLPFYFKAYCLRKLRKLADLEPQWRGSFEKIKSQVSEEMIVAVESLDH